MFFGFWLKDSDGVASSNVIKLAEIQSWCRFTFIILKHFELNTVKQPSLHYKTYPFLPAHIKNPHEENKIFSVSQTVGTTKECFMGLLFPRTQSVADSR